MNQPLSSAPSQDAPPLLLLSLVRDWRLIRNCVIVGITVAIATLLAVGPRYSTQSSIIPQGSRSGQLRGLAAQLGFDVAGSEGAESPYFYIELLKTQELLSRVVARQFTAGGRTGDYAAFRRISERDSAVRTVKAIKAFAKRMSVLADRRTGIVSIVVTESNASLTLQLSEAVLQEIARYNRQSRQSRASSERQFVETRLAAGRRELASAEDSLQQFVSSNRRFDVSPELSLQYARMQRSVTQHSMVVSSLAQNYEQARIDEVRDTPVFTIVQPPRLAPRPDSRSWWKGIALGAAAGLLVSLLLLIARNAIRRFRTEEPEAYEELVSTIAAIRTNPLRR